MQHSYVHIINIHIYIKPLFFLLLPLKGQSVHKYDLLNIYLFAWLENTSAIECELWIFSLQTTRHWADKWNSG